MKKTSFIFLWFSFVILLFFPLALLSLAQQSGRQDRILVIQNEAFELEVIRLANLERTSRGLPPLLRNSDLTDAARNHNLDMIANDFFSHTGSDGSWPHERACREGFAPYDWGDCYAGENIAAEHATPSSVVTWWMSNNHRDNILEPRFREIGLGYNTGGSLGHYWTMVLGSQPFVLPVFIKNDAEETMSRDVTITLTKEDVSSWGSIGDITGIKISEDPLFTGLSWQPWAQTKTFVLSSGDGIKTVYVKFTDDSNQVTSNDTILLNGSCT
ncbi:MAG: CAP domain-containing protein, partial [Chloroflexi bacterium]|nr:CAP domain-containing protein [Chloroflexota bacterium]